MADIVLPPKVVFFVETADPTARIEMTSPRMVINDVTPAEPIQKLNGPLGQQIPLF